MGLPIDFKQRDQAKPPVNAGAKHDHGSSFDVPVEQWLQGLMAHCPQAPDGRPNHTSRAPLHRSNAQSAVSRPSASPLTKENLAAHDSLSDLLQHYNRNDVDGRGRAFLPRAAAGFHTPWVEVPSTALRRIWNQELERTTSHVAANHQAGREGAGGTQAASAPDRNTTLGAIRSDRNQDEG